ncbi:coxsackievirus and adenovirus receptor homolog isoform X2 [Maylandia zebra]|uniref:coxsackievirus and adenovirus receptor homolog isoform X2 n=1 Tax=Maylandia zebra TaxID=106582 RepID=UPI00403C372E
MSHILLLLLLTFETVALEEIKVRPRQDVTLHCQDPSGVNITLLEWSIPEIKSDGYVFFYRNRRSYESYQHERFKGRVELKHPSMKNGDVSVILKNVNINDTGTYECRIITSDLSSGQRVQSESRQSIDLTVIDSVQMLWIQSDSE